MSLAVHNSPQNAEIAFLESLRADYESRGYKFIIHPAPSDLPEFFATYAPDAIATRSDKNVAIELKSRANSAAQQSLQEIRQLFEGRPNWQFRVVYAGGDGTSAPYLPIPSRASVLARLGEVDAAINDGRIRAAFMDGWSLLEAALNSARPEADKRPRTPEGVVQALAMDGLISIEAEKSLRSLIDLRNRVVHGDLTAKPIEADVRIVLDAVRAVLD